MISVQVSVQLPNGDEVAAGTLTEVLPFVPGSKPSVSFEYDTAYLANPQAYELSPEIPLTKGMHTPAVHRGLFHSFQDAAPDSWGRELLQSEADAQARKLGRQLRRLTELEVLLRTPDCVRQGALRFSAAGGEYLGTSPSPRFEQQTEWGDLVQAADVFRESRDPEKVEIALRKLFPQGSTAPGGARPKVNVRNDSTGSLRLAKFPTSADRWNVSRWEAIALDLAKEAGIEVPGYDLFDLEENQSILLLDRFDRINDQRVGYMSARTMLMHEDNDYLKPSYQDLARRMKTQTPARDRQELFRRIAFTLLVTNADDHMRNHGFIRFAEGWRLSPSFDVNPIMHPDFESTRISRGGDSSRRTLSELVEISEDFALDRDVAEGVIQEVRQATAGWRKAALNRGEDPDSLGFFEPMFEHENSEIADKLFTKPQSSSLPAAPRYSTLVRRGQLGLGTTPSGGNAGSFAKHTRQPPEQPPESRPAPS